MTTTLNSVRTKPNKDEIWTAVIDERRRLVEDLRDLEEQSWDAPTACPDWSVHDLLAHVVDTARMTRAGFVRDLLAARFDFDRANQRGVERTRRQTPTRTLADLEAVADRRTGPPVALATRLEEAFVHGEDVRRAVGLRGAYPSELVAEALRYQMRTPVGMGGGRERVTGLRLVADDVDFALGDGAEVQGSVLALLLAVSGRRVERGELNGPAAAALEAGETPWDRERLWGALHAERAALVDDLTRLNASDWDRPTLCPEWNVEDVTAHLLAGTRTGRVAWLRSIIGARFNPDEHNRRLVARHLGANPAETLAGLRREVSSRTAASGHTAAWLGEVIVHAQDIRRPLGIATTPDVGAVVQVARFFASRDFAVPSRKTVTGLRLEADDAPFATGPVDGALIRGPVLALTMVMAGRAAYLADLQGPGVPTLAARLSA